MKDADQILALRRVDAGLAADGTVDLGQQRCWNLHETDTAAKNAGSKPCKIANNAATERHNDIAALKTEFQKPLAQRSKFAETFCRFAGL